MSADEVAADPDGHQITVLALEAATLMRARFARMVAVR